MMPVSSVIFNYELMQRGELLAVKHRRDGLSVPPSKRLYFALVSSVDG